MIAAQAGLELVEGEAARFGSRAAGVRARARRRPRARRPRGRPVHRHVSRRHAVPRRGAHGVAGSARARRQRLAAQLRDAGAADGAAQDRHAAAARRAHDRLGAARGAAVGRRRLDDVAADAGAGQLPQLFCAITRTNARTPRRSFAPISTARRCSPARSSGAGRATARRSRTRSTASAIATATRCFSSPRAWTTRLVYPNGI